MIILLRCCFLFEKVPPNFPRFFNYLNPLFLKYQKSGSPSNGIAYYHQLKRAAVIFKWDYSLSSLMENSSFIGADRELATILLQWAMMHDVSNIYGGNLPSEFTYTELDTFVSALEYLISLKLCFFGAGKFREVYLKFLKFAETAGAHEFQKFRDRLDTALTGAIREFATEECYYVPATGVSLLREEDILKLSGCSPAISRKLGEKGMLPVSPVHSEDEYLSGVMSGVESQGHCGLDALQFVKSKCQILRWTIWNRNKELEYGHCGSKHNLFEKLVKHLDQNCPVKQLKRPKHEAVLEYVRASKAK